MKTHPDSIFVKLSDIADLGIDGSGQLWGTSEDVSNRSNVTEFVPAAAYIKLQERLEKAEYSANGFESLYDAAHEENESLKAQLQTQTENMRTLREFVEIIANVSHFEELPGDLICQAQDLIGTLK